MNENMLFTLCLVAIFAAALIAGVLLWTLVAWTAFRKITPGSDAPLHALTTARPVLQTVTVLMVIFSALILALNKIIGPEAAAAMLSAALGYAFGQATSQPNTEPDTPRAPIVPPQSN
jgi:hypothetical protein